MDIITSSKNEKIKNITALQKQKKARSDQGLFVVEGARIVRDTLRSAPKYVKAIYASESFLASEDGKEYTDSENGFMSEGISLTAVSDRVFETMCETVTPQGLLALVKTPEYSYKDLVGEDKSEPLRLLLLEDIQDPGNLGTMIRTAEAAGMKGIIMSRGTTDIFAPKVIRSTMGGIFRVPFIYADSFTDTLDRLEEDGVRVYAAYLRNGEDYRNVRYADRSAVLIGNEGNGLTDGAVAHASQNVYIPMAGEIESLNAAVAAAILMYSMGAVPQ